MHVLIAARTSPGRVRKNNQDAALAVAGRPKHSWVLAVADGVGGLLHGAEASRLVVETIADTVRREKRGLANATVLALEKANASIFESGTARGFPSATTIVVALIEDGCFEVLHAGDSRAYLLSDGDLRRLTDDHSWVAEQVRAGHMSPEEAAASTYRNIINRCIGAEPSVQIERRPAKKCVPSDVLLLCSDGLHGLVPDPEIASMLARDLPPGEMADQLVQRANHLGGTDNIGVALARFS